MTILQHSLGETSVLCVHGSLRAPVDTALRLEVDALLRRGQRGLLLDLAGVSGLDAAGVGELVHVYNMAVAANGTLRVAHVLGKSRELLVRVGLIDLLTMDAEPGFKNKNVKLSPDSCDYAPMSPPKIMRARLLSVVHNHESAGLNGK